MANVRFIYTKEEIIYKHILRLVKIVNLFLAKDLMVKCQYCQIGQLPKGPQHKCLSFGPRLESNEISICRFCSFTTGDIWKYIKIYFFCKFPTLSLLHFKYLLKLTLNNH
jgi:hypothetical protein